MNWKIKCITTLFSWLTDLSNQSVLEVQQEVRMFRSHVLLWSVELVILNWNWRRKREKSSSILEKPFWLRNKVQHYEHSAMKFQTFTLQLFTATCTNRIFTAYTFIAVGLTPIFPKINQPWLSGDGNKIDLILKPLFHSVWTMDWVSSRIRWIVSLNLGKTNGNTPPKVHDEF